MRFRTVGAPPAKYGSAPAPSPANLLINLLTVRPALGLERLALRAAKAAANRLIGCQRATGER